MISKTMKSITIFVLIFGMLLSACTFKSSVETDSTDNMQIITAEEYYDAIEAEYAKYHTHVNTIGYNKDDVFTLEELEEELKNIRESADLSNYDSELDAFVIGTNPDMHYYSYAVSPGIFLGIEVEESMTPDEVKEYVEQYVKENPNLFIFD